VRLRLAFGRNGWPYRARKRPPRILWLYRYSGSGVCGFDLVLPWFGKPYQNGYNILMRPALVLTVDWG